MCNYRFVELKKIKKRRKRMGHVIVLSQTTSEIHLHQLTPQHITTKTDSARIGTATTTAKEAHLLWISQKKKLIILSVCLLCVLEDSSITVLFLIKKVHLFHYFHCSPNSKTTSDLILFVFAIVLDFEFCLYSDLVFFFSEAHEVQ